VRDQRTGRWAARMTYCRVVRVSSTSSTTRILRPRSPPWVRLLPSWRQRMPSLHVTCWISLSPSALTRLSASNLSSTLPMDVQGRLEQSRTPPTHRREVEPLRSLHLRADRLGDLASVRRPVLDGPATHTAHRLVQHKADSLDRDVPLLALVVDLAERPEDSGRDEPSSADRDEERRGCARADNSKGKV